MLPTCYAYLQEVPHQGSCAPQIIGMDMIVLQTYTQSPFLSVGTQPLGGLCLGEFRQQALCFLRRTTYQWQSGSVAESNLFSSLRKFLYSWSSLGQRRHIYMGLICSGAMESSLFFQWMRLSNSIYQKMKMSMPILFKTLKQSPNAEGRYFCFRTHTHTHFLIFY